ncbi:MAG: hypothetical protein BAJALOKI1v1_640008 [Promethearchaeota archaeon]|nr:MAG: hypothetical protein BAJALOKI1v1_640008 [Candidatus Lokiarchaeota archaeon]
MKNRSAVLTLSPFLLIYHRKGYNKHVFLEYINEYEEVSVI